MLIPEAKKLNVLLKEFRLSRNHMAIVVDEYGVSPAWSPSRTCWNRSSARSTTSMTRPRTRRRSRHQTDGTWSTLTPIGDFNEAFRRNVLRRGYDTIGGLVTRIGHLPEVGDELALDRFMFRVARADARRVQAFHVTVLPPDAGRA